jgi:DNA-binding MarR family transcriptional regulator
VTDAQDRPHGVTLLYLIKQVELAIRQQLDEVAATRDLTAIQYTALTVLERHPGMTSAELARNSFVRAQTMAQLVTSLLDGGLLTRDRNAKDRKQYLLFLSEKGRQVVEELRAPVAEIEKRMLETLDTGQKEILHTYLLRCRHSLNQHPLH